MDSRQYRAKIYTNAMGYIYKITNIRNNKIYIGQTNDCKRRWAEHRCLAHTNHNYKSALYAAMRKYGNKSFTFEVIEECADDKMSERERFWIQHLNSMVPNGYNMTPGGETLYGEHNPFYGKHHSEHTKALISAKNTGRKYTPEELERCRQRNAGRKNPFYAHSHTPESLAKQRATAIKNGTYEKFSQRMKENNPNADGRYCVKHAVEMLDIVTEEPIMHFASMAEAGQYIRDHKLTQAKFPGNSIGDVCAGRQDTAFGYKWRKV